MDIWILVIVLLVIAVILLVLSLYNNDSKDIEKQLNEFTTQQSQEMYSIKSRLSELEKGYRFNDSDLVDPVEGNEVINYSEDTVVVTENTATEETTLAEVSNETREEVIRLYSQGYTMHEIGHEVALNTRVIQDIIDDYIENR
ncbi:hypothetical protein [Fundicoccus culcitae]|uniref:Helix-turn-helix domain-containing protein n=1 Tax=Fundicoccus culcitae TaxID=2969821 RepID=A0ABY5P766_9LACT|nr:hypothetical protein [Fundicoccus culcitae]UUX34582.1 hypothetical protein NRE15_02725 [Fundicoccus culcitae]